MTRYFFTSEADVLETVKRAIAQSVSDICIINCSGDAVGFWVDMDLAIESQATVAHITERAVP